MKYLAIPTWITGDETQRQSKDLIIDDLIAVYYLHPLSLEINVI